MSKTYSLSLTLADIFEIAGNLENKAAEYAIRESDLRYYIPVLIEDGKASYSKSMLFGKNIIHVRTEWGILVKAIDLAEEMNKVNDEDVFTFLISNTPWEQYSLYI